MTSPGLKHDKPRGCTNFKLRQLMRRVARHYDQQLALAGMKSTQFSMLSYLVTLGPVAPGELAREMGLEPSTLTRNLRPLIAQGWVAQGPGADARSREIDITPAGRAAQATAKQHWKQAQLALNALLGEAQVAALHGLIDHGLARLAEPRSDDGVVAAAASTARRGRSARR